MLLIWGFKARFKATDQGHFHCPHEGGDRVYEMMEVKRWFTFFFIPLIPLNVLGRIVRCTSCGSDYDPAVLSLPTAAQLETSLGTALRHALVAMVHADGPVLPEEREAALKVMREFGMEEYNEAMLDTDLAWYGNEDVTGAMAAVADMLSPDGREAVMRACLHLGWANDNIDPAEEAIVQEVGRALGLSPAHVSGIMAEAEAWEKTAE